MGRKAAPLGECEPGARNLGGLVERTHLNVGAANRLWVADCLGGGNQENSKALGVPLAGSPCLRITISQTAAAVFAEAPVASLAPVACARFHG